MALLFSLTDVKKTTNLYNQNIIDRSYAIMAGNNAAPIVLEPEVSFSLADGSAFSDESISITAKAENTTLIWKARNLV